MHEYDVALKRILTRPGSALLESLVGRAELNWLNVELPRVNNLRVDLLGALPDGELIHFEFQSRNQGRFALRMAEYAFAIARRYGRFPRQIAIYVGEKPLRMKNSLVGADFTFRFQLLDTRALDGEPLLASRSLSDNVFAILTRAGSEPGTVRRIVDRIAGAPEDERGTALAELAILAGLRGLSNELRREEKKMPITENIMDNPIIGPLIRKGVRAGRVAGRAEGRLQGAKEGRVQGAKEGRVEGQMELLLGQIEKRFGKVPPRIRKRLAELKPAQIKAVGLRLLDAQRIDDLFGR